jgi:hypothetical protein
MAVTRNTSPIYPVSGSFNTNPPYSGNFIPAVWSAKLNEKFYAASVYGEIANTSWEGDIASMGDKVLINTAPSITIANYTAGTNLTYEVPTPDVQELNIDKGKYFAFQINDVLEFQAKPNLLDMFSGDAAEQMRIAIDSNVIYNTFTGGSAANKGATAGVKSSSYNLGTDAAPVALNGGNVLQTILQMASVLDEQNVPESDRWLLIDPATRTLLMQSNLAQAQFMGDSTSAVRNGKIGKIDRFTVYVSNQLPKGPAGSSTPWVSGDGSENSVTTTGTVAKRRAIIAGHKSAITFASQITKMETVRNPNDFGDYIRSLNVYGFKVVKGEGLALAVVDS